MAFAFEQTVQARQPPRFLSSLPGWRLRDSTSATRFASLPEWISLIEADWYLSAIATKGTRLMPMQNQLFSQIRNGMHAFLVPNSAEGQNF